MNSIMGLKDSRAFVKQKSCFYICLKLDYYLMTKRELIESVFLIKYIFDSFKVELTQIWDSQLTVFLKADTTF